jgi:uncharacterized membrane protein YvbJ
MKRVWARKAFVAILFVVAFVALQPFNLNAQTSEELLGKIESAIKKGDSQALAQFFNSTVEITIGDNDQDYARNQAQFVVKEFFTNYPPRTFTLMHKGGSGDKFYAVGSYISTRGTFDTNVLIQKTGNNYYIFQLRFEKAN